MMSGTGEGYCISLLLVGMALTREGDGDRVREALQPELLDGVGPKKALDAIQGEDRDGVKKFLASIGIPMVDDERAVDAILRTFLMDAKSDLERQLAEVNRAMQSEDERVTKT